MKTKLLLISLLFLNVVSSQSQPCPCKVKASYIEKITRLTDWQDNTVNDSFIIAVLGESPFKGELEKLASNCKIKNKPIKITYLKNMDEITHCQLLFISSSEKNRLPDIISQIENYNILLVSDTPGFCSKGVHLNFFTDASGIIHYEINPNCIKKAKLAVDMQLLSYGKIVN